MCSNQIFPLFTDADGKTKINRGCVDVKGTDADACNNYLGSGKTSTACGVCNDKNLCNSAEKSAISLFLIVFLAIFAFLR